MAIEVIPGGVTMGRSFESMSTGVTEVSERWLKASMALKKEDGKRLAEMAKMHSSEALDDLLEAAAFSELVEMIKSGKI